MGPNEWISMRRFFVPYIVHKSFKLSYVGIMCDFFIGNMAQLVVLDGRLNIAHPFLLNPRGVLGNI